MTSGAFAILQYWVVVIAQGTNFVLTVTPGVPTLPQSVIVLVLLHVIFLVAFWANQNTEEWRRFVEETTRETAADDVVER